MKTAGDFLMKKILSLLTVSIISVFLFSCSSNKFTVTWVNFDGTVLEIDKGVKKDSAPEYNGAIPFRPTDDKYSYNFSFFKDSDNKRISDGFKVTKDCTFTAYFSRTELSPQEKVTYSWVDIGSYFGTTKKLVVVLSNGQETSFNGSFRLRISSEGKLDIFDWNTINFDIVPNSQGDYWPLNWALKSTAKPRASYLSTQYTTYYEKGLFD